MLTQTQTSDMTNTVLGIAYEKKTVTDYKGVERNSFTAIIGSSKYQCFSIESLKNKIKNHTKIDNSKALEAWYNKGGYTGD